MGYNMNYEIRLLDFNDGDVSFQKIVDLQNVVYEGKHKFRIESFRERYLNNPMGKVISFNAFYNDEIVAHYACVPYKMKINGRIVLGLFDIATATHPDHRGKGLFKTLAKTTFQYAKENGFEFVLVRKRNTPADASCRTEGEHRMRNAQSGRPDLK